LGKEKDGRGKMGDGSKSEKKIDYEFERRLWVED
jgi:hypothetical protein